MVSAMFRLVWCRRGPLAWWVNDPGDGSANVGPKLETLVATMIAGGSHIGRTNRLRAGATSELLRHHTSAPSTLGTWLRCFDKVSVTQLDLLAGELFVRAWNAGLGRRSVRHRRRRFDSTVARVFSSAKEGAAYGYAKSWAITRWSPRSPTPGRSSRVGTVTATPTPLPVRVGCCRSLLVSSGGRGTSGPIEIRADSGFWAERVDRPVCPT